MEVLQQDAMTIDYSNHIIFFCFQGYYADPEADCQSFHVCANLGDGDLTKYSLLCPNGTLFNQQYFICDWWFNVDCSVAEDFYSLNEDIVAEQEAIAAAAAGESSNELSTYTLPDAETFSGVVPPDQPPKLVLPPAAGAKVGRRRGPKKTR